MTLSPLIHISPTSFKPSTSSSSLRILISTPGSGKPTLPVYSIPSNGLAVPTPSVSDIPQPSKIGSPVISSQRLAVSGVAAIPPTTVNLHSEKSSLRKSGWLTKAWNSVFTPGSRWKGRLAKILIKLSMSRGLVTKVRCWPTVKPTIEQIKA